MSSNASNEVFQYTGRETIPKDVTVVHIDCSVTGIEEHAFRECTTLASITIPSTVTYIGWEAFYNCSDLREVVLNKGLVKIGEGAFANCETLERITLSTVTEIGPSSFSGCTSLKEVVLNEGLQKIDDYAFAGCESLQSINLPSTVKIGGRVFYSCINLREVVCIEGLPAIEPTTFIECRALERITFPIISSRLEDIIQAGQVDVQNKIQQYINRGVIEWERRGTIYISMYPMRTRDMWGFIKEQFHRIIKWIKYYEMKEGTTLFELALWKAKIDQVEDDIYEHGRDLCRVDVPGPVKDTILQYLDL